MHLNFRNVNDAFEGLVGLFVDPMKFTICGPGAPVSRRPSRNGYVMMIEEPMTITYTRPRERVLFNTARDANPFFHLYEALWMLSGRNDVAPVAYYCKQMREYSDLGATLNGAYGYRWRYHASPRPAAKPGDELITPPGSFNLRTRVDQLDHIVSHLKADPDSRRAVLQMWSVEDDLIKVGARAYQCERCGGMGSLNYPRPGDGPCHSCGGRGWVTCPTCRGDWSEARAKALDESPGSCPNCAGNPLAPYGHEGYSRDVCCNLSAMFSLRDTCDQADDGTYPWPKYKVLDMTVTNRSNDLVWGLLGANYVHFSILQEYMAARLGVEVGYYSHFTNNLHAYVEREDWKPLEWLAANRVEGKNVMNQYETMSRFNSSSPGAFALVPLVQNPARFDDEVKAFVERHRRDAMACEYGEPFLRDVAQPLCVAWHHHKRGDHDKALATASSVKADDWRFAATNWLMRRAARRAGAK